MKRLLILLAAVAACMPVGKVYAQSDEPQKAVLISGASTGIGRLTAEHLAEAGYFVYAGARKQEDLDSLNAIVDPLIEFEDWTMDFVFDVNVFGVVRVTRAFAPLIIESRGRIVTTSSISGVLSGGLTGYGFYAMSKHAIEAFSDQLSWEMMKLGVHVAAVEPGNFGTNIGTTRCGRMLAEREERRFQHFADEMNEYYDGCAEWLAEGGVSDSPPPVMVADAIQHALFAESPREHYLVVADQFEARITIGKLLEELVHMNEGHDATFSREELIQMLDGEEARYQGKIPPGMPGVYE
jgi:NAD(P)-dependent dehydrogenase (short-subunit alcohol dehydrogenase family)